MANQPQKRTFRWIVLYSLTGLVDAAQIVMDFFVVGIAVSEALEAVMPFVIAGLCLLFKIKLTFVRGLVIVGGVAADAITGGLAPFWVAVILFLHRDVNKEEAGLAAQKGQDEQMQNRGRAPLNQGGVRQPVQEIEESKSTPRQPLNVDGMRQPVMRGDIPTHLN
ncbi:MAG: hypothetical protein NT077_00850 [Candidatus Taylorbacteria bacterium]|nr:hypothetical protein [Candidatus Taylorbacteria bacterium]